MFELFKARRGRKAAVATIAPLVERSRHKLTEIPEGAWLDPYMVGFMGMLISLVAIRATGRLGSQAIGIVQGEAWGEITGCRADVIGEEICLLSAADNRLFQQGCLNAGRFLEALEASGDPASLDRAGDIGAPLDQRDALAPVLWEQYFEAYIASPAGRAGAANQL